MTANKGLPDNRQQGKGSDENKHSGHWGDGPNIIKEVAYALLRVWLIWGRIWDPAKKFK